MKIIHCALCVLVLCSIVFLASCDKNKTDTSKEPVSNIVASGSSNNKDMTTTDDQIQLTSTSVQTVSDNTFDAQSTQTTTSSLKPDANVALADFDWNKVSSFRICHTQSPPFKAITLKKGAEAFSALVSLLKEAEGTYVRSSQGLSGGFMPIYVYDGETKLDRIQISINGTAAFSTDTQQEASTTSGLNATYASIYTMEEDLASRLRDFLEKLEYTEDI